MDDGSGYKIACGVIGAITLAVVFVAIGNAVGHHEGKQEGTREGRKAIYREAVRRGHGIYKADGEDKYGNPTHVFVWKE